jgi:hypothetical protein
MYRACPHDLPPQGMTAYKQCGIGAEGTVPLALNQLHQFRIAQPQPSLLFLILLDYEARVDPGNLCCVQLRRPTPAYVGNDFRSVAHRGMPGVSTHGNIYDR